MPLVLPRDACLVGRGKAAWFILGVGSLEDQLVTPLLAFTALADGAGLLDALWHNRGATCHEQYERGGGRPWKHAMNHVGILNRLQDNAHYSRLHS